MLTRQRCITVLLLAVVTIGPAIAQNTQSRSSPICSGRAQTVRYHLLNPMLNEVQKQSRQIESQAQQLQTQLQKMTQQAQQISALEARLRRLERKASRRQTP